VCVCACVFDILFDRDKYWNSGLTHALTTEQKDKDKDKV
jgi:hypothetical protein